MPYPIITKGLIALAFFAAVAPAWSTSGLRERDTALFDDLIERNFEADALYVRSILSDSGALQSIYAQPLGQTNKAMTSAEAKARIIAKGRNQAKNLLRRNDNARANAKARSQAASLVRRNADI